MTPLVAMPPAALSNRIDARNDPSYPTGYALNRLQNQL